MRAHSVQAKTPWKPSPVEKADQLYELHMWLQSQLCSTECKGSALKSVPMLKTTRADATHTKGLENLPSPKRLSWQTWENRIQLRSSGIRYDRQKSHLPLLEGLCLEEGPSGRVMSPFPATSFICSSSLSCWTGVSTELILQSLVKMKGVNRGKCIGSTWLVRKVFSPAVRTRHPS